MMCYKDMTFCASDCTYRQCHRHKIGLAGNFHNLPISMEDFSAKCDIYKSPDKRKPESEQKVPIK